MHYCYCMLLLHAFFTVLLIYSAIWLSSRKCAINSVFSVHNSSVPMIGHLELATGMLTSHASWAWLLKICLWSQIFLRCIRADLDLIVNEFKRIGFMWSVGLLIMNAASDCLLCRNVWRWWIGYKTWSLAAVQQTAAVVTSSGLMSTKCTAAMTGTSVTRRWMCTRHHSPSSSPASSHCSVSWLSVEQRRVLCPRHVPPSTSNCLVVLITSQTLTSTPCGSKVVSCPEKMSRPIPLFIAWIS